MLATKITPPKQTEFDPDLLHPVAFAPVPAMSEAERARLYSQLLSRRREAKHTQATIAHLESLLATT